MGNLGAEMREHQTLAVFIVSKFLQRHYGRSKKWVHAVHESHSTHQNVSVVARHAIQLMHRVHGKGVVPKTFADGDSTVYVFIWLECM